MAKSRTHPIPYSTKSSNSSIAGASGGTLLLLLARNLPDQYPYKSWLVISAPSVTIFIIFLWKIISRSVNLVLKRKKTRKIRLNAVKEIDELLEDPNISEDAKAKLRCTREGVRLSSVEERLKRLVAVSESD